MRSPAFALLAVALLVAGCANPPPGMLDGIDPVAGSPPTGKDAGSAGSHGEPERTASAVTLTFTGGRYVARQTVTVRNDFGGAAAAEVTLTTENGNVAAAPGKDGGYLLVADLEARADTEARARELLATLRVESSDALASGTLRLGMEVEFPSISSEGNAMRGARLTATLPPEPSTSFALATANGGITVRGLHGPGLAARTSNGGIDVQGAWDVAELSTSNGNLGLSGTFNTVEAETSNGNVVGHVRAIASARQSATTSNGGIGWNVIGKPGVDLDASTSNGQASSGLAGTACARTACSGRTEGYDAAPVQVELTLRTTNGNVAVE